MLTVDRWADTRQGMPGASFQSRDDAMLVAGAVDAGANQLQCPGSQRQITDRPPTTADIR
ncbi:hypothetical protein [Streptomyces sp. N2A]|uniref:hypothetical protein n=1 Tax=Streptomyces sp. N2A TaxID=3073936 RepID=UPI002870A641|nr:hypothetical protein [Streptomyces sp. N2A]